MIMTTYKLLITSRIRSYMHGFTLRSYNYTFYTFFATWGVCLVVLIFLAIQTLYHLAGIQIAENSRTSNIPVWLPFTLPTCVLCVVCRVSHAMGHIMQKRMINIIEEISFTYYYISGVTFTLTALLGWIISTCLVWSARDNRNRQIAVILFFVLFIIYSYFVYWKLHSHCVRSLFY